MQAKRLGMPLVEAVNALLAGASFTAPMGAGCTDVICRRYHPYLRLVAVFAAQAAFHDVAHVGCKPL